MFDQYDLLTNIRLYVLNKMVLKQNLSADIHDLPLYLYW